MNPKNTLKANGLDDEDLFDVEGMDDDDLDRFSDLDVHFGHNHWRDEGENVWG